MLTADQREVYDCFCSMIDSNEGGMLFLDAPGGTDKTFLINLILAKLRSEGKIALATASSGIAATLLTGGRTLHSTFKIRMQWTFPYVALKRALHLVEGKATVADEAPMTNKLAFEAIDRTLRDLTGKDQGCAYSYVGTLDRSCRLFRVALEVTLRTPALRSLSCGTM